MMYNIYDSYVPHVPFIRKWGIPWKMTTTGENYNFDTIVILCLFPDSDT